jgi:type I restriction enzyme S subunit
VKSGELRSGIITITEETITSLGLKNSSAKQMPPGTILLAMYGATVGALAKLGISAATNQAVCCITPGENLDEEYLLTALDLLTPTLLSKRVGGAQPNISQQIIRNLRIPLPPIQQQQIFSSCAQSIREISNKCRASRSGIENLFQTILHRAFTGELTEGWRKAHMKELLAEMELQSKALGKLEEAA